MSRIALILLVAVLLLVGGYIQWQRAREVAILMLFGGSVGLLLALVAFADLV